MPAPAPQTRRRGFSLFEVLVVLAMVAMLTGLIVVNVDALFNGIGSPPVERVLQRAVREARYLAVTEKDTVALRYDEERRAFLVLDDGGNELYEISTGRGDADRIEVTFFHIEAVRGLEDDPLDGERTEAPRVGFHSDRSSTPFEAEIREGSGTSRTFRFDAFSDVLIETDD